MEAKDVVEELCGIWIQKNITTLMHRKKKRYIICMIKNLYFCTITQSMVGVL